MENSPSDSLQEFENDETSTILHRRCRFQKQAAESTEGEDINSLLDSTENSPLPSLQMVDHPQENEDNTSNDDSVVCLDDSDEDELGWYSPVSAEKMKELMIKHSKQVND